MKHLISKTMAAVPVLALALAVGGCGSSSNDEATDTQPTAEEIRAAAMAECTAAGGRFNDDDSCTSAAELAEEAAEAARLAGIIEGRRQACVADDGRWNDDNTCTSAAELLVEAEMACETAKGRWNDDDSCTSLTTLVADTKRTAIATEAGQGPGQTPANPDAGLGGSAHVNADTTPGNADDPYTLEISRDNDGTTIKITDLGMMGDDDPKFEQARDLGDGTTMHVRAMKADDDGNVPEEVAMITTDIEAPKATPFGMVAGQALNANASGVTATGVAAVAFDPGGALVVSTDDAQAMILANMMADDFEAAVGESVVHTFNAAVEDDASTTEVDESKDAAEVAGTYNGAMGTYKCTGTTDCTVTVDDEGDLTAASDGWIFTPAKGATSDVPDADYLHYGFWLARTKDSDGDVTSYDEVETFAGSSLDASGDVSSVTGTAEYKGGATGVYVHDVLNSDGSTASSTSGHFTANANLTATFGQVTVGGTDTIADNMLNTVTGTIDKFVLSGEEAQEWSVALSGTITAADGDASGTAKGGVGDGSFSADFHGPVAAVGGVVPHPHSVVGEFNAGFTNGTVAGGFGAREVEDE